MILWPLGGYRPLVHAGAWRLSARWHARLGLGWDVARFPEGTVYRGWCGWLLVKLSVKA